MLYNALRSKIHRISVTSNDLDYEGSIFIDENIVKAAEMMNYEQVSIYNINNGQRFSTYIVSVKNNPGYCQVNGAAARLVYKNDLLIVCSYSLMSQEELLHHKPTVVLVNDHLNKNLAISKS